MPARPKIWQWPNIWSIDAALIAIAWQFIFARSAGHSLSATCIWVLGLSVWLTYLADRLLDVRKRSLNQLLSYRHRLAKKHSRPLWTLWGLILLLDLILALRGLSHEQLEHGFVLLLICLTYTVLNQTLSKRFFPKELCVGLIYAGGVVVFQLEGVSWLAVTCFALLCSLNCIIVSAKESAVDAALEVQSLTTYLRPIVVGWLLIIGMVFCVEIPAPVEYSLALCFGALALLQVFKQSFHTETFRVLCDTVLFLGLVPLFFS